MGLKLSNVSLNTYSYFYFEILPNYTVYIYILSKEMCKDIVKYTKYVSDSVHTYNYINFIHTGTYQLDMYFSVRLSYKEDYSLKKISQST